jgi:hypothetical protein
MRAPWELKYSGSWRSHVLWGGESDSSSSSTDETSTTEEDNRAGATSGGIAATEGATVNVTEDSTDTATIQAELLALSQTASELLSTTTTIGAQGAQVDNTAIGDNTQIVSDVLGESAQLVGGALTSEENFLMDSLGLAQGAVSSANSTAQTAVQNTQPSTTIGRDLIVAAAIVLIGFFAMDGRHAAI